MSERLLEAGAAEVYAAVSHAVLGAAAADRLGVSPISRLLLTDTIEPLPQPLPASFDVVSAGPLFARAIRNVHERTSVSGLFGD